MKVVARRALVVPAAVSSRVGIRARAGQAGTDADDPRVGLKAGLA